MSLYNFCIKDSNGHVYDLLITEAQALHILDIYKITFEQKDQRYPPPWVNPKDLKPPFLRKVNN